MILTHNLSALLFMPVAAAYMLYCFWESGFAGEPDSVGGGGRQAAWACSVLALVLAAGLAAFYVLPVLAESPVRPPDLRLQ